MSGRKAVLDSNFLVYISKGMIDLKGLFDLYDSLFVSVISYVEVYGYNFENETERSLLDDVFDQLEMIDVSTAVATTAVEYRKNASRKIKIPDALILATARSVGAALITNNLKDFQDIDPAVDIVEIDKFRK